MTTALVLTGGGARGAYQAGVLTEVLPWLHEQGRAPTVLCGASVGALNAAAIAANAHLPVDDQVGALVAAWDDVRKSDVLKPFLTQVPSLLGKYLSELTPFEGDRLRGFIETDPLADTLEAWVDWDTLADNTGPDGPIDSLVVFATEIVTGAATAFVSGAVPDEPVSPLRYVSTRFQVEHLVASASIPLLFEATLVPGEAEGWYCDGSTRLARPLGPAVDAGADDVVVISCNALSRTRGRPDGDVSQEPDLGDVLVNVLDAMMSDVLLDDLERCQAAGLECAVVGPDDAEVIASIARAVMEERYGGPTGLLRSDYPLVSWALGGESPRQAELMSYLLFDHRFVTEAMAVGAEDGRRFLAG